MDVTGHSVGGNAPSGDAEGFAAANTDVGWIPELSGGRPGIHLPVD